VVLAEWAVAVVATGRSPMLALDADNIRRRRLTSIVEPEVISMWYDLDATLHA